METTRASVRPRRLSAADWDAFYREGTPAWDTGKPAAELLSILKEGLVKRGSVLDVGCGSGANAVALARLGFDVTAIDFSPTAIERARTRAELAGVNIRFVLEDAFEFARSSPETFDFVLDAGFYHFVRQFALNQYLDFLWRVTRPGSSCLVIAGATGEAAEGGPPQVSEEEVRLELGRLFEFRHLRPCRLESPYRPEGYLAWSCLLHRPVPPPLNQACRKTS